MIAVIDSGVVVAIITIVGGGGFVGGIIALLKLRPEAGQITVTAAQGAVIVQTTVIEALQEENRRIRDLYDQALARLQSLENAMSSLAQTHARLEVLERERERLEEENRQLRDRVLHLEEEVRSLRAKERP